MLNLILEKLKFNSKSSDSAPNSCSVQLATTNRSTVPKKPLMVNPNCYTKTLTYFNLPEGNLIFHSLHTFSTRVTNNYKDPFQSIVWLRRKKLL